MLSEDLIKQIIIGLFFREKFENSLSLIEFFYHNFKVMIYFTLHQQVQSIFLVQQNGKITLPRRNNFK
jgi:hypothetical protein